MSEPTDEPAFLAAILASPDDDLPRLVFADWLDENHTGPCRACGGTGFDLPAAARLPRPTESRDATGRLVLTMKAEPFLWKMPKCPTCNGTKVTDNGHASRAEFIRVQVELAKLHRQPCSVASGAWVGPLPSGNRHVTEWPNSPPGRCVMPLNEFGGGLCRKCEAIPRLQRRAVELWATMVSDKSASTWCKVFGDSTLLHVEDPKVYDRRDRGGADSKVVTVSRGFPELVACTLADWCGVRCVCRTAGGPFETSSCCNGAGIRGAIGPRVVAAHPVTRVTFAEDPSSGVQFSDLSAAGAGWFWGVPLRWAGDSIAIGLVQHPHTTRLWGTGYHATRQDAEKACSDHFIAWAKEQNRPLHDLVSEYLDGVTREIARGLMMPARLIESHGG